MLRPFSLPRCHSCELSLANVCGLSRPGDEGRQRSPLPRVGNVGIHREGAFPSAGHLTRRAALPRPDAPVPAARPRSGSLGHVSLLAPATRIHCVSAGSVHRHLSAESLPNHANQGLSATVQIHPQSWSSRGSSPAGFLPRGLGSRLLTRQKKPGLSFDCLRPATRSVSVDAPQRFLTLARRPVQFDRAPW